MSEGDFDTLWNLFVEADDVDPAHLDAWIMTRLPDRPTLRQELAALLQEDREPAIPLSDNKAPEIAASLLADAVAMTATDRELPQSIGSYRIVRELGRGGMGTVYLARQANPDRAVAIKILNDFLVIGSARDRFAREARLLGRLRHVGIARIYEAGVAPLEETSTTRSVSFLAMEYVEGSTLTDYANEHDLDSARRLDLIAKIADAVEHAHRHGVIHRDLKPGNILVDTDGQPKVLDFGVARQSERDAATMLETRDGQIIGTIPYMSPEQIAGTRDDLDERSDVYSLGVVTFELLSGRLPIELERLSLAEAALAIREEDAMRLSSIDSRFRGDVEVIVGRALAKDPARRYRHARDLAADIRRHLNHEPIHARPSSHFYRAGKFVRRHRGLVAGLGLTFLALVVGLATSLHFAARAIEKAAEAERRKHDADHQLYVSRLTSAQLQVRQQDWIGASRSLESVPARFRGIEWKILQALLPPLLVERNTTLFGRTEVAFDDTGRPLVVARRSGRTVVLDMHTAAELCGTSNAPREITDDNAGRPALGSISPGGRQAALWNPDAETLEVVDVATAARRLSIALPTTSRLSLRFDDTSRRLAVSVADRLTVWDVETGKPRFDPLPLSGRSSILKFERNGSRLAFGISSTKRGRLRVIDAWTGEPEADFVFDTLMDFDWSDAPDELFVMVVDGIGRFDVKSGRMVSWLDRSFPGEALGLFYVPGGRLVAVRPDQHVWIWNQDRNAVERKIPLAANRSVPIASFRASSTGRRLLIGQRQGAVVIPLDDPLRALKHATFVYHLAFHPSGTLLAGVDIEGEVRLWDSFAGRLLATFSAAARSPNSIGFSPCGRKLIVHGIDPAAAPKSVVIHEWDLLTGRNSWTHVDHETMERELPPGRTDIGSATRSRDGRMHAVEITSHGHYRVTDHQEHRSFDIDLEDEWVLALAFDHEARRLALGCKSGRIDLWDVETESRIATWDGHDSECFDIAFDSSGTRLFSAGRDGVVIRDLHRDEVVLRLTEHASYVHDLDFSPDGRRFATASGDATIRVWDTRPSVEQEEKRHDIKRRVQERRPEIERLLAKSSPTEVWETIEEDASLCVNDRGVVFRLLVEAALEE